ncbi:MAG TPA: hydantoinase/carbamoylase family amidase [Solirubrobacteraceae bacterium]|nr:hydantoinase/carbamoylase family amidase [Solirubrobacteraceae bacterium]
MADPGRIARRLEQLWALARGPEGGADRPAYSNAEADAMLLVAGWAREQQLAPAVDEHGNLWALPADWDGQLITAGSHVDTVPDGGRYDGALGTVLGLELARDLEAGAGGPDPRSGARAGVLVCAAEEAPRFEAGTIGSRLLAGTLTHAELERMRDAAGMTAADALSAHLAALAELPRIDPPLGRWLAHAEVHVAPRRELRTLGVVSAVASPRRFAVELRGVAGHCGEVPMEDRRDALAAAAELVLAVEAAARSQPPETVATVGTISVSPGALSVIPARARLGIDARAISSGSLAELEAEIRAAAAAIAERRGVRADVELVRGGEPVAMDRRLVQAALSAASRLGIAARETWSGSGHDAQHLASLTRALLVFVPLHGGECHTPQEGADLGEALQACAVVAEVLRGLALAEPPAGARHDRDGCPGGAGL